MEPQDGAATTTVAAEETSDEAHEEQHSLLPHDAADASAPALALLAKPPLDPRVLANVIQSYEGEILRTPRCDVPVFHGTGRLVFRSGFTYAGDFFLGRMHGCGRIEWTNGVVFEGHFVDNEMCGVGSYVWPNGSRYTGGVVAGKRHGRGVFTTGCVGVPTVTESSVATSDSDAPGGSEHDHRVGALSSVTKLPLGSVGSVPLDPFLLFTFHDEAVQSRGGDNSQSTAPHLHHQLDDNSGDDTCTIQARSSARYEGEWRDGLPHGDGILIYDDVDNVRYEGQFARGKRHGHGQMRYASGNVYAGKWVDDRKKGYGVMRWLGPPNPTSVAPASSVVPVLHEVYEGEWEHDEQHGFGRHVWLHTRQKEKNYYEGEFARGLRHGLGVFYYANGARYEGEWRANAKHDRGTFFYEDGRVFHGAFANDRSVDSTAVRAMETAGSDSVLASASGGGGGGSFNNASSPRILLYIDELLATPRSNMMRARSGSNNTRDMAATAVAKCHEKAKRAVEHAALRLNTELRALYRHAMKDGAGAGPESVLILETIECRKLLSECGVHLTGGHVEQIVNDIRAAQRQSVVERVSSASTTSTPATNAHDRDRTTDSVDVHCGSPTSSDTDCRPRSLDDTLAFAEKLQRKNTLPLGGSCAGVVPHDQLLLFREFVELLVRIAHWRRTEQDADDNDEEEETAAAPGTGSVSSPQAHLVLANAFAALCERMARRRMDAQQQQSHSDYQPCATRWLADVRTQLYAKETQIIRTKHSVVLHILFAACSSGGGGRERQSSGWESANGEGGAEADELMTHEQVNLAPTAVSVRSLLSLLRHMSAITTTTTPERNNGKKKHAEVFGADFKLRDALAALEHVFVADKSEDVCTASSTERPLPATDPFFADSLLVYSEFLDALAIVLLAKQRATQLRFAVVPSTSSSLSDSADDLPLYVLLDQFLQHTNA